jgi:hypothetical protein
MSLLYLAFIESRGEECFMNCGEALYAFIKFLSMEFDPVMTGLYFGTQMRYHN